MVCSCCFQHVDNCLLIPSLKLWYESENLMKYFSFLAVPSHSLRSRNMIFSTFVEEFRLFHTMCSTKLSEPPTEPLLCQSKLEIIGINS